MRMFDALNSTVLGAFRERADDRGVVTIQKGSATPVTVAAIFDENFYAGDDGEQPTVDLVTTISIRTADFPGAAADDSVSARGRSFVVRETRPDSEGMTILELELS